MGAAKLASVEPFFPPVRTPNNPPLAPSELPGAPEGRHLHHGVLQAHARPQARRPGSQEHEPEAGRRPGEGGATGRGQQARRRAARQACRLRDQQVLQAFVFQAAGETNKTPNSAECFFPPLALN